MKVVKIPTESIQLKDKVVPKHVVIFQDKVVHTDAGDLLDASKKVLIPGEG